MNGAQIVQHLQPGGIERLVLNLLRFSSSRFNLKVIALEGHRDQALQHWPELRQFQDKLIFLNKLAGFKPLIFFQLRRLVKQHKIQFIHSHHLGPLFYSRPISQFMGLQHVHTEHDSWHLENPKARKQTQRLATGKHLSLIADANHIAKDLQRYLKRNVDHVILNGIDSQIFTLGDPIKARAQLRLPPDCFLIGATGRLVAEKGMGLLLQALAQLPLHYHIAIAGIGPQQSILKQQAKQLGIQNRVHWLNLVDDMPLFYQAIDLFCLPSTNEGLPLSLLEAQSCGKWVVATDVGAVREVITSYSGHIIADRSVKALTDAILNAPLQPSAPMIREHIIKNTDVRIMVEQYEKIWSSAL
ncbi:glycosyltransferase [Photobacterium damselae subsp. damselae]|uniref:glycosyltransferase n=1 Tax=Photobacterium damselae TaxID=38293 RepID=UPI000A2FFE2F|nr:glycosyltransferase [Photobacterium damselae]ARR50301.1 hypothetical protein CAY62_12785 [Photobacterium damselae subsp. damselae]QAY35157.1 glycosyltransferase [Photobacterium damselae subsp. damselae]